MSCLRTSVIGVILIGSLLELARSIPHIPCDDSLYSPCRCNFDKLRSEYIDLFTCDGLPIDTVKEVLQNLSSKSKRAKYLTIENSELTDLPREFLGNSSVTSLLLKLPNLERIDENAFVGQENSLFWLALNGGKLSSIPVQSISKLNALSNLVFEGSNAKLQQVTQDTFAGLTNANGLEQLLLVDNGIEVIGKGALKEFTNLKYLYLNKNNLREFNADSLPPQELRVIGLDENKLTDIPKNVFVKMVENGILHLNFNNIVNISSEAIANMLTKGINVHMSFNALRCDCGFKQVAEFLEDNPFSSKLIGRCAEPPGILAGRYIGSLKASDFSHCN